MTHQISYTDVRAMADRAAVALEPFVDATALYPVDDDSDCWIVAGYCERAPDAAQLDDLAVTFGLNRAALCVTDLGVRDWLAENRRSFSPLRVGRFFIYPSVWDGTPPAEAVCFEINAAQAFGTGHHATTRGCLHALEYLAARPPSLPTAGKILDVGCGTGILSMAAAALFPDAALYAVDIDPNAIDMMRENWRQNKIAIPVHAVTANGLDHARVRAAAPFDRIIANILPQPLCDLAPQILAHRAPRGQIILSGFYAEHRPAILAAYDVLRPVWEYEEEKWCTVVLSEVE